MFRVVRVLLGHVPALAVLEGVACAGSRPHGTRERSAIIRGPITVLMQGPITLPNNSSNSKIDDNKRKNASDTHN